jgi:flagellar biosynthesis protein FliQ
MTIEMAVDIINQLLSISLTVMSPFMMSAILVGLAVSVLQTVTSIQEQTLTFVPKLVVIGIVLLFSANWVLRALVEFCTRCIQSMASLNV